MTYCDLLFPARGESVPTDHAYALYGALSRTVPAFHQPGAGVRFAPLTGVGGEPGRLRLTDRSCLRVRLPAEGIAAALPLAGAKLDVAGSAVRLGVPAVVPLRPAAALGAGLVTFKHGQDPDRFLATARAKLAELGVAAEVAVRRFESGPRTGEPRRRVVRLKGRAVVGYAVIVTGLSAGDSVRLQERGLGGRTRLGCGFFLPVRARG